MSFTSSLIKTAVKWTPKSLVLFVGNIVLKDIAKLTDFSFDFDTREAHVQTLLAGEVEPIDVRLEGFAMTRDEEGTYYVILEKAESNKLWMTTILAHITGRHWKIPHLPQFAAYLALAHELFKVVEHSHHEEE